MSGENNTLLNEDKKSQRSYDSIGGETNPYADEMCCCCICQCSTKKTEDLSCCGCFPIKCGLVTIGGFTIFLVFLIFAEIFYMLLLDNIHWWYVLVALLLCVPLLIAVCFWVVFFSNDTDASRSRLKVTCMFVIISAALLAAWNVWYFLAFFHGDEVTYGSPETGYWSQSKKQYIFFSLFIAAIIIAMYMYFMCVTVTYQSALEKKVKRSNNDDAKSSKSKKSSASKKSGSKKGDEAAGDAAEGAAE